MSDAGVALPEIGNTTTGARLMSVTVGWLHFQTSSAACDYPRSLPAVLISAET